MKMRFKRNFIIILACAAMALIAVQCKKDATDSTRPESKAKLEGNRDLEKQDSQKRDSIRKDSVQKTLISYTAFLFPKAKKDSAMAVFKEKFSKKEQYTILALNRYDPDNLWRVDTLVIPDKFYDNFLKYSPFPAQISLLKEVKKFVYFSYPIQAFAVYENGDLTKWGPSSMGKKSAITQKGLHFTNWKSKMATSTVDSDWKLPYNVNIANRLGIGWHKYDLPGFPASHSCLRLLEEDAEWLYSFTDQWILSADGSKVKAKGIPVIVDGDYAWGQKKPWRTITNGKINDDITIKVMDEAIKPHIETIIAEQKNRDKVLMAEN